MSPEGYASHSHRTNTVHFTNANNFTHTQLWLQWEKFFWEESLTCWSVLRSLLNWDQTNTSSYSKELGGDLEEKSSRLFQRTALHTSTDTAILPASTSKKVIKRNYEIITWNLLGILLDFLKYSPHWRIIPASALKSRVLNRNIQL